MPDYAYYCDHYLGEDIPETEFAVCMRRAEGKLAYMKEVYAVQPRKGLTAEEAENMALCAIADAVYGAQGHVLGPVRHRRCGV